MYRRQYHSTTLFFLSFVGAFLAMGFLMVLFLLRLTGPGPTAPAQPQAGQNAVYLPSAQDRLTLFAALEGPTGDSFALAGFYPDTGSMPLVVLPRQLALGGTTLQQLYRTGGAEEVLRLLGQEYGVAADRRVLLADSAAAAQLDRLGSVDLRLPTALYEKESGLALGAGLQAIDGSRALALCRSSAWPGGELQRCALLAELGAAAVNTHLPAVLGDRAESLFKMAVNACRSTDLSAVDYETYLPAARFMARLAVSPGQALALSGSHDATGVFLPDEDSRRLLAELFGG